jgi:hypothetical protein
MAAGLSYLAASMQGTYAKPLRAQRESSRAHRRPNNPPRYRYPRRCESMVVCRYMWEMRFNILLDLNTSFRVIIWIRDVFPILSEHGACRQSCSRKRCSGTPLYRTEARPYYLFQLKVLSIFVVHEHTQARRTRSYLVGYFRDDNCRFFKPTNDILKYNTTKRFSCVIRF